MTMCNIHIHILSTHCVLLDILTVIQQYTFYIMYTYIHTKICKGAADYTWTGYAKCHGCALDGIQW